jgi:hypothetical protein
MTTTTHTQYSGRTDIVEALDDIASAKAAVQQADHHLEQLLVAAGIEALSTMVADTTDTTGNRY